MQGNILFVNCWSKLLWFNMFGKKIINIYYTVEPLHKGHLGVRRKKPL